MPLLVAPVAFQRVTHPDGEVATARAARDAGTIMYLSTIATYTSTWGTLFAGCVIVVVPILLTYALLGRRIVEGMTLGAAK